LSANQRLASKKARSPVTADALSLGATALQIENLNLTYWAKDASYVEALKNVDLSVERGEFIALLGPSGCGKSSLLRVVCGLTTATSGSARLNGADVTGARRSVGLVPQAATLLPWLKVIDNVLLPAKILRLPKEAARQRAYDLLEMTGLKGFEGKYPRELSGGMQQRVSVARALLHDPDFLLMDEPFAALDALTRDRMSAELQSIWMATGKTVLFVTHSINEALFLADRVIVMTARPGRIVADHRLTSPRPRRLDSPSPENDRLAASIRGVLEGREDDAGAGAVSAAGEGAS
jgi:NitT/TauT family transport system ATP-binding protein